MNQIIPLGVHFYRGCNVTKQMLRGRYFALGDVDKTLQQPCIIRRFRNAKDVPMAREAAKITRMQAQIKCLQSTVTGSEHFGLFGFYQIPKRTDFLQSNTSPLNVLKNGDNLSALYFFYPRGGNDFFVLAYTYWGENNFALHSILAHACQSYFVLGEKEFANTGTWLTEKFLDQKTGKLSNAAAVSFVMGYSKKQAAKRLKALERSIPYSDQRKLFREFEENVFESNPENRGLLNVVRDPIGLKHVKIERFDQHFIEPGSRRKKEIWGIRLNPLQAFLYLNRFMLAMLIAIPACFEFDSLYQTGATWLEIDSGERVVSMNRYIEDAAGNKYAKCLFRFSRD
jgi:hypothetical protein